MSIAPEIFSIYTDFIAKVLKQIRFTVTGSGVQISFDRRAELSLDERIRKIDKARENLVDGLAAIDELRQSAEESRNQVKQAFEQLIQLEKNKEDLQSRLRATEQIIESDIQAFREVAGIPSPATVRRERVIGFVSGIVASTVASGVVYGLAKAIEFWPKIAGWFG